MSRPALRARLPRRAGGGRACALSIAVTALALTACADLGGPSATAPTLGPFAFLTEVRPSAAPRVVPAAGTRATSALHPERAADGVYACPPTPLRVADALRVAVSAPAPRRDRGFLWRLRRDGRESYLYGTLHLGKPAWVVPGPKVQAALDASDVLALEIDPLDADAQRPAMDLTRAGGAGAAGAAAAPARWQPGPLEIRGRGPESVPAPGAGKLPDALQERLDRQVQAACLTPVEVAAWPALRQLMTLSVLSARWDGLDPAYSQELALSAMARRQRRSVIALESVDQQRQALQGLAPGSAPELAERLLHQLETGSVRRVLARIGDVWEQGDLGALEDYESWCDCAASPADRRVLHSLNEDRNLAMADRVEALHRGGARVFAAVGALHMAGPRGLPQQLRERGFQVDRLLFGAP
jgi:uncharacterized protein YbaP (TraB family)